MKTDLVGKTGHQKSRKQNPKPNPNPSSNLKVN